MPAATIPPDANVSVGPVTRGSLKRKREDGSEPLSTQRPWRKRKTVSRCLNTTDLSPEEREHRDWLQQQPCTIVDCTRVKCHRCFGSIKLNDRKPYDISHWTKHHAICRAWSAVDLAKKRHDNIRKMQAASQASTPADDESAASHASTPADDESGPSAVSELRERSDSRSPSPWIAASAPWSAFAPGPLRSHLMSRPFFTQAYPGLNVLDLNVPLTQIPEWSPTKLKVPQNLVGVKSSLSGARWEDDHSNEEGDVDEEENRPPTALAHAS